MPSIPPVLNMAMDSIFKSRYDKYRAEDKFPPEMTDKLAEEGVLVFKDLKQLDIWRTDSHSLMIENPDAGYVMTGKIDDVMVEPDGRLVPADYKSSGNPPAEDKQKYYRDQLAAYGLMFAKHGHLVSDRAYLLHYWPTDKTNPSIEIKFSGQVDKVVIDLAAIEQKLKDMVKLLNGPYPGHNEDCENCAYHHGRPAIISP